MIISYLITPFLAWLVAGCTKFAVNSIRAKKLSFDLIGYGGMHSNHSSIVSSSAAIIFFKEGTSEPALVVAIALAFIVMLDANSLRKQVGKHASAINKFAKRSGENVDLRERMGHSRLEIFAGCLTGILVAWVVYAYEIKFIS